MVDTHLRILLALVGDMENDAFARVKYGPFSDALQRAGSIIETSDVSLRGFSRIWNALQVFSPSLSIWRERFWKNLPAFDARSQRLGRYIRTNSLQWDVVLQMGVIFDARYYQDQLPAIIYTDYTASLSAERPASGRSPFSEEQRYQWIEREKNAYLQALHIFTRSFFVRESIVHDYGIPKEKITVIGAGVNFYHLPEVDRYGNERPSILFLGKEFYRKGGDILLDAFEKVRMSVPSARLRMLTEMPKPGDFPLEGVEIISPTWDRAVIEDLYREADLFVLPSRLETWGDVLLEAMAYSLPCVGVRVDAMEEIILDGETGVLVPAQDSDALAGVLVRLLNDPHERVRMGQAGRKRVEESFTWDGVALHMLKVVNRLIGEERI